MHINATLKHKEEPLKCTWAGAVTEYGRRLRCTYSAVVIGEYFGHMIVRICSWCHPKASIHILAYSCKLESSKYLQEYILRFYH